MESEPGNNGNGKVVPEKQGTNKRRVPPIANRWKPGQSGNPKGRPKRKSITDLAHELLDSPMIDGDSRTGRQLLAEVLCRRALKGDRNVLHELLARIDPAPSGNSITINNNLRAPIMDALDALGVKRAESIGA